MSRAAALLRCFANPNVVSIVRRLGELDAIGRVVLIVDVERDPLDTPSILAAHTWPVPVVPVLLRSWGWAASLNAGLAVLDHESAPEPTALTISAEVVIADRHLDAMVDAAELPGASCGFATFAGREELSYRVPRNTCCAWPRSVLRRYGGFSEEGDGDGGMEDYTMALDAWATERLEPRLAAERLPLVLRPGFDQAARIAWEARGMAAAERRHSPGSVDSFRKLLSLPARSRSGSS